MHSFRCKCKVTYIFFFSFSFRFFIFVSFFICAKQFLFHLPVATRNLYVSLGLNVSYRLFPSNDTCKKLQFFFFAFSRINVYSSLFYMYDLLFCSCKRKSRWIYSAVQKNRRQSKRTSTAFILRKTHSLTRTHTVQTHTHSLKKSPSLRHNFKQNVFYFDLWNDTLVEIHNIFSCYFNVKSKPANEKKMSFRPKADERDKERREGERER